MKRSMVDNVICKVVQSLGDRTPGNVLHYYNKREQQWQSESWAWLQKKIDATAKSLIALGLNDRDNVGIFSPNMPEWAICDLAIMSTNAVTVPIYPTNTSEQAAYILKEAEIKILFVGTKEQYDSALALYSRGDTSLEKIIVFDGEVEVKADCAYGFDQFLSLGKNISSEEIAKRQSSIKEDDLATIIYTSGTTGEPKGVMLMHSNFRELFRIHDIRLDVDTNDHSLCFLPLSHVFERSWTLYMMHVGAQISFLQDPKGIVNALKEVKPTVMCAVPRLYQKAYHSIMDKVTASSGLKKKIFAWSLKTGLKMASYQKNNLPAPFTLRVLYAITVLLVFGKIRKAFGGRLRMMPCAGAPFSVEMTRFYHAAGLPILIGYGLTETTASVTVGPDYGFKYGSVGVAMPDVQVKIGEQDEIMVKGNTVMKGYYKKPEETAKVFDGEWFKTGDAGRMDDQGNLIITDRIKDLMKTSGGKYIAPQPIESLLTNDNFISQAVVVGDDKPYVTALLVPNFEALVEYAKSINVNFNSIEELLHTKDIKHFFELKMEQLQKQLASFEKVKKFRLLAEEFEMHLGELTPTLKVRRAMVIQRFEPLINEMYK